MKCYLAEIPQGTFVRGAISWLRVRNPSTITVTFSVHHALRFADKESAQQVCDASEFPAIPVEHIFN